MWLAAAKHETNGGKNMAAARPLLQRGIRFNKQSQLLWQEVSHRHRPLYCTHPSICNLYEEMLDMCSWNVCKERTQCIDDFAIYTVTVVTGMSVVAVMSVVFQYFRMELLFTETLRQREKYLHKFNIDDVCKLIIIIVTRTDNHRYEN